MKLIEIALANHLWQSTLFAAAAAALTLVFRKNGALVRYRLWMLASIKFLVPFSLLLGIGGRMGARVSVSTLPGYSGLPMVFKQIGQPFPPPIAESGLPLHHLPGGVTPIEAGFMVVWILGAAIVLGFWGMRWRRVAKLLRSATSFNETSTASGISSPVPIVTVASNLEPGIFGILYPVLILPENATPRLRDSQLQAIVAHEMFHVRGRDNLVAAIHTIVESVFWFHPLVWWLGARLVDERERACDEAVLQAGFAASDYAEGIIKICECYIQAPACMAGVSGSNLKKRIEEIMDFQGIHKLGLGKRLLLIAAGAGTVACPLLFGVMNAAPRPPALVPLAIEIIQGQRGGLATTGQQTPAQPVQRVQSIPSSSPSNLEKWPDDVSLIISDKERAAFRGLGSDAARQLFVEQFWLGRDLTPGTATNEFREEYDRRVAYANEHFSTPSGIPGSKTDRGKMFILNGPPNDRLTFGAGGYYRVTEEGRGPTYTFPSELWKYRHLDGKGDNVVYEFVDSQMNGDYRLEYDPTAKEVPPQSPR